MGFIVAVDGTAGSGKGTITKIIADKLNLISIDTGAMYRCVALECINQGIEYTDLEKIKNGSSYDMILMDIMMPNLNGWDTTRRIRSMKRSDAERVPVIAMSANAFAEDIINSRISGMDEHLTKPLDPARLVNALKDCVWRRKHKL